MSILLTVCVCLYLSIRYLLFNFHQLDWCTLKELARGIGTDTHCTDIVDRQILPHGLGQGMQGGAEREPSDIDQIDQQLPPHLYHRNKKIRQLLSCLQKYDGKLFDIRCNFVGLDDAVRLRKHVTKSITSQVSEWCICVCVYVYACTSPYLPRPE